MLLYLQKNEHSSQYLFCLENHGIQKKIRLHNLFTQIGNKRNRTIICTGYFVCNRIRDSRPLEGPLMYANNIQFSLHTRLIFTSYRRMFCGEYLRFYAFHV